MFYFIITSESLLCMLVMYIFDNIVSAFIINIFTNKLKSYNKSNAYKNITKKYEYQI